MTRNNAGGGWKGAGKFAKCTTGMIAFGTVMGGAGAASTGCNFWQGAVTGLVVSGLNHAMHQGDDNGYDEKGNKINDKGGDKTDYLYDKDGNIITSTSVMFRAVSQGEYRELGGFRGYGVNGFAMPTGAITEDNSFFEWYAGGKVIEGIASGFRLIVSRFVYRTGGESTFKIGILHKSSNSMLRFEKHSLPLKAGGRAYPVHFNIEKPGSFNIHLFPNPNNWGKFKVN